MSYTVEKRGTAQEFQVWSERAIDFPGFISKGWAMTDYWSNAGLGWVSFETKEQAMMFKLSS